MPQDDVKLRLGVDGASLDSSLDKTRGRLGRWAKSAASDMSRAMRGAFSGLTDIAGFGGIASLGMAARGALDFEKRLVRLGIQARSTGAEMVDMRKAIDQVSVATGVDRAAILGGMEKFVALTGDVGTARDAMASFAKISMATGAGMDDVATTAAALSQNLGITGQEMVKAFSIIYTQGKDGAIELKDMAQHTASLAAQFQLFGAKGVPALAEMGGMLQIVRRGFGTSAEAATGFESLMTGIVKHGKQFRENGIEIFKGGDPTKGLKDMEEIVFDLITKTKGNPELLTHLLGRVEAVKALISLMHAGRTEVDAMIAKRGVGNEIEKDFVTIMDSAEGKIGVAGARMKVAFGQIMVDHLDDLVAAIKAISDAVVFLTQHLGAAAAAWSLFKLGGSMGQLGGVAGGLGGGGGRGASGIGGAMQGAGIGLVIASTLGRDLGTLSQAVIVSTSAFAGLPGKLGTFGIAVTALQVGILALAELASGRIDAKNKAIASSKYDEFSVARATELGVTPFQKPYNAGMGYVPATGVLNDKQRAAAQYFLNQASSAGALDAAGNLDEKKLNAALAKDMGGGVINPAQVGQIVEATRGAVRSLSTDPELLNYYQRSQGLSAGLGQFAVPSDASSYGVMAGGPSSMRLDIRVTADPGFAARVENDPAQRRR